MVRSVNFMNMGPLWPFICCEVSSPNRSNAVSALFTTEIRSLIIRRILYFYNMTLEKLDKLRMEVNFFNLIMSIYKTTTGNIIPNSKRLNVFLLILRTRHGCLLLLLLLNSIL